MRWHRSRSLVDRLWELATQCMHARHASGAVRVMHARWRVQCELSPRLAAADSARVGEAGLVGRELAVEASARCMRL